MTEMTNCPCYCAIYSAAPRMPAAVVALVTDYGHTFSDSDFESLTYTNRQILPIGVSTDMIPYVIDDTYADLLIRRPRFVVNFVKNAFQFSQYRTLIHCHHENESWDYMFSRDDLGFNEHAWEYLQEYFSQDGDYIERRRMMWKLGSTASNPTCPGPEPMPEVFDTWCNAIFKFIGDQMYSRPHTLVCPWLPDPMYKK